MKILGMIELAVWTALVGFILYGQYNAGAGVFTDVNSYVLAHRTRDLIDLDMWKEMMQENSNYPYGEILNNSRFLDVVWMFCTMPFMSTADISLRIYQASQLVSSLGLMLVVVLFVLSARGTFSFGVRTAAILMLLIQKQLYPFYGISEPRDFTYIMLCVMIMIMNWYNFSTTYKPYYLLSIGFAGAVLNWITPVGAVFVYIMLFGVAIIVATSGKIRVNNLLSISLTYSICLTLFYLMNPPAEGLDAVILTRLSLFYVVAAWLFSVLMIALYYMKLKTNKSRALSMVGALLLFLGGVFWYASNNIPSFSSTLSSLVSDDLMAIIASRIDEVIAADEKMSLLVYPILAMILGLFLLASKEFRNGAFINMLLLSALLVVVYWYPERAPLAAMAAVLMLGAVLQCVYNSKFKKIMVLVAACFLSVEIGIYQFMPMPQPKHSKQVTAQMIRELADLYTLDKGVIFSDYMYGPVIMWYTSHAVIGTPNFSNRQGILDSDKIWKTTNMNEAHKLLKERQVTHIFLPSDYDRNYFSKPKKNLKTFYGKIITGKKLPQWLKKIKVREGSKARLYQIRRIN